MLAASRSFYEIFRVEPEHTIGCMLYDLGDGQWDIPALRLLLETILPEKAEMNGFEVDHNFPGVGRRIMLLNARKVLYETSPVMTILLAFTDITDRRAVEQEKTELFEKSEELVQQKQVLLATKPEDFPPFQRRLDAIAQAISGYYCIAPVFIENFKGPRFDLGYPELYPAFRELPSGEIVIGAYRKPPADREAAPAATTSPAE